MAGSNHWPRDYHESSIRQRQCRSVSGRNRRGRPAAGADDEGGHRRAPEARLSWRHEAPPIARSVQGETPTTTAGNNAAPSSRDRSASARPPPAEPSNTAHRPDRHLRGPPGDDRVVEWRRGTDSSRDIRDRTARRPRLFAGLCALRWRANRGLKGAQPSPAPGDADAGLRRGLQKQTNSQRQEFCAQAHTVELSRSPADRWRLRRPPTDWPAGKLQCGAKTGHAAGDTTARNLLFNPRLT